MRESHLTLDRNGLFDPQPLRTFTVLRPSSVAVLSPAPVEVKAHMANQTETGSLVFIELKGGLAFTVRAFAAGQWSDFSGSVPTEDEVRSIKAFAEREQAITRMLQHDERSTRQ